MAKTVNNVKINTTFTTAASREQLTSGENLCTSLGKVNKYLVDLDAGAFSFPANGGNADTLNGKHASDFSSSDDNYCLYTLDSNGNKHGPSHLLRAQFNVKNDGRFYIQDEDGHQVRVNYADNAEHASTSDTVNSLRYGKYCPDIFSTSLNETHDCWNRRCYVVGQSQDPEADDYVENAPEISNALWYEVFTCGVSASRAYQIAMGCFRNQRKTYIRYTHDSVWSDWSNIADGGNADTLDGLHANEIASNPTLLINPDFAINQRGQNAYSSAGYTVDGWKLSKHSSVNTTGTVSVTSDGIIITSGGTRLDTYFRQHIENGEKLAGKKVTASFEIAELTGSIIFMQYGSSKTNIISNSGVHRITFDWEENSSGIYAIQFYNNTDECSFSLKWAKLEIGSVATPFVPPDSATELLKIQSMNDDGTPKLLSNSTLPTIMNSQMVSNPNLFINSDFRHPINQRGKTSYDTEGYTIDLWGISTNLTLTVCDGYIKLVKSVLSGNPTFLQSIENMSGIAGETVTFSMHYRSNVQLRITGLDKNYYIPSTNGEWGDYKLTFTAPTGVSYLFAIQFTTAITQADNYIDIMWTKAELGSVATPFCPPDPAVELMKCQRYFVRLKNEHASAYAYNGTGYIMDATTAVITLALPAVMRIPKPTVTASGENIPCIITPSTPVKTPLTATYSNNSAMLANSISLVFTISNGAAGEPAMFLLKPGSDYIDISAEL